MSLCDRFNYCVTRKLSCYRFKIQLSVITNDIHQQKLRCRVTFLGRIFYSFSFEVFMRSLYFKNQYSIFRSIIPHPHNLVFIAGLLWISSIQIFCLFTKFLVINVCFFSTKLQFMLPLLMLLLCYVVYVVTFLLESTANIMCVYEINYIIYLSNLIKIFTFMFHECLMVMRFWH